jgi:hypothetical protein
MYSISVAGKLFGKPVRYTSSPGGSSTKAAGTCGLNSAAVVVGRDSPFEVLEGGAAAAVTGVA